MSFKIVFDNRFVSYESFLYGRTNDHWYSRNKYSSLFESLLLSVMLLNEFIGLIKITCASTIVFDSTISVRVQLLGDFLRLVFKFIHDSNLHLVQLINL